MKNSIPPQDKRDGLDRVNRLLRLQNAATQLEILMKRTQDLEDEENPDPQARPAAVKLVFQTA